MRILVVDDLENNRESAKQTLKGHDLALASTYGEAVMMLCGNGGDYRLMSLELDRRGIIYPGKVDDLTMSLYKAKVEEVEKEIYQAGPFDVVLLDLMMPASTSCVDAKKFQGQEMAVGFPLALLAGKSRDVKYIGIASANHHDHPMATAALDHIGSGSLMVGNARLMITQAPMVKLESGKLCKCEGNGCSDCYECDSGYTGVAHGKDWGRVLAQLLEG
jgi:CheY-like chemotaxis protein